MKNSLVKVTWPDESISFETTGTAWLEAAKNQNISIPTGCLGGSCGACEIEVNGNVIRACIGFIEDYEESEVFVCFSDDPYW